MRGARGRLLAVVIGLGLVSVLATTASAAPTFSAKASMTPKVQYLNDTTGTVFTFTVVNTGDTRFAAVEIARPSPSWIVRSCPRAPAGWTTERHVWGCRFRSRAGAADDIPGHSSNANFRVRATVRAGSDNIVGRWRVVVSRTTSFSNPANLRSAPPLSPGLRMVAYSFQVLDAVVVSSPRPIGSACPARTAANHSAITGATGRTIAICGRNRTNTARTPNAGNSSLGGTFIASHGGFSSGPVRANSGNVVLGNWANVTITSSPGTGKSVAARIGSAATRTSPLTPLGGYTSINQAPVAAASMAATNEDTASGTLSLLASDANGDPMTFSIASGPAHGTLGAISADPCPSTAPAAHTCTATVVYTPAANYNGPDSFTYIATDGFGSESAPATVSLTVNPVNDNPVVNPATFTIPENSPNGTAVGTVTSSDVDTGQTRTYAIVGGDPSGGFAINASSGAITVANSAALNFETTPSFSLTVRVTDNGSPVRFGEAIVTVNLTDANDAPVVTTTGGQNTYTENALPTVIDGGLTVSDVDDTNLESAVVRISANFQAGDSLGFAGQGGITGSYNSVTGVLTLTGSSSVADYQTTLRSVQFSTPNDDPAVQRTVAFRVNDGSVDSTEATKGVTITPVNDAPTITTNPVALAYTEGSGPTAVDAGLTLTDPDSANIQTVAVQISSFCASADDELVFVNQNGITGSSNDSICELILTGSSSLANYQTALRSITYTNSSEDPSGSKTVEFQVSDTASGLDIGFRTINLTAVNDAPTLNDVTDPAAILEDAGEQNEPLSGISAGGGESQPPLLVTAISSDTSLIPNPTVTYTSPNATGLVAYAPVDDASGTADITVTVTDNGGTANGGVNTFSQTFTVAVTAVNDAPTLAPISDPAAIPENATEQTVNLTGISAGGAGEAAQVLLFAASSSNTGLIPNPTVTYAGGATGSLSYTPVADQSGSAVITVTVTDDGGTANGGDNEISRTFMVTVVPPNDAPVVTTSPGSIGTSEDAAAVVIDATLTVTDADDANLGSGVVRVSVGFQDGDNLGFADTATIIGSYAPGTGILTLTGSDTVANYQAALRSVTFRTTQDDPTPMKTFGFKVNDGVVDSNEGTREIAVTDVNDTPTVTTSGGNTLYTENAAAMVVDSLLTVADPDDANLESGRVRVSVGFDAGDSLLFSSTLGITGSYNPATGVLTLTGMSSVANYQTALRSVTFTGTDDSPTTSKTIAFRVNDGDVDSAEATKAIAVTPTNDQPTDIALSDSTIDENQPGGTTVGTFTTTDPESGDTHTYEFVAGAGDDDNLSFHVNGASLDAVGSFNFEAKPSYTIRVRSSDSGSPQLNREEAFTITIGDVNEAPTDIDMDKQDVDENEPVGTVIGTFSTTDVDTPDTHTYAIVSGLGDENNDSFTISGDQLLTDEVFDFETKDTYLVRVESTDSGSLSFSWSFSITINDINDAPDGVADSYDAVGNTGLFVGSPTPPAGQAAKQISGSLLANDTDQDGDPLVIEPVSGQPTTLGGTVTIEADGDFVYQPDDGDLGAESFTYHLCDVGACDGTTPSGNEATVTATVTLTGQVWYVHNLEPEGGDGTSDTPFNTLLEAEAQSGAGDTVFAFAGTGTTFNMGGSSSYIMDTSERLFGEANGLTIDPDGGGPLGLVPLYAATGNRPRMGDIQFDAITLASGAEVRGLDIDPNGNGGGIFGGAGVAGGTIDNVHIEDTLFDGLATQPGLELNGTSGTFNISNLEVDNSATGVLLVNAGTVNFLSAGTISINSTGAKGLDAAGTNLGTSEFDDITVAASPSGGVSLVNTAGTVGLGDASGVDLSLTTTSGSTAALLVNNATNVVVGPGGTDTISATGGPAIDVVNSSGALLEFDTVSSTNSASDGINISGAAMWSVTALGGTISGASGISLDIDGGGAGNFIYAGSLNDGPGEALEITNRTGGAVQLSGAIADGADAGGGITLSGNTGGSTSIGPGSVVINSGATGALVMSTSNGHTLTITGNLDIDTTSGAGIAATNSGTIAIAGATNTIDTTTGTALNVSDTDIGALGLTFRRVSANGAANGILLTNTGSSGGLTVTGDGTAANNASGGLIQNTTGHGIALSNTRDVSLTAMSIQDTGGSGIDGTSVTNFGFAWGTIALSGDNGNESNIAFNSTATGNNIAGTLSVTNSTLSTAYYSGVDVQSGAGTVSNATISNNVIVSSALVADSQGFGISIVGIGSASTSFSLTKATIASNTITNFPSAAGVQVSVSNTDASGPGATAGVPGSGTDIVAITGNTIHGASALVPMGTHGIAVANGGGNSGSRTRTNFSASGNDILNTAGTAFLVGNNGYSTMTGDVTGNTIVANHTPNFLGANGIGGGNGVSGAGVAWTPDLTLTVSGNTISATDGNGILLVGRGTSGTARFKIQTNAVAAPINALGSARQGIRVDAGNSAAGSNDTVCVNISGNTSAGSNTALGIGLRKQGTAVGTHDFGINGLVPSPATGAQAATHVAGLNPLGGGVDIVSGDNFVSCSLP